jgi:hypothetical protein
MNDPNVILRQANFVVELADHIRSHPFCDACVNVECDKPCFPSKLLKTLTRLDDNCKLETLKNIEKFLNGD